MKALLSLFVSLLLAVPVGAAPTVFKGPGRAMSAPLAVPVSAAGAVAAIGFQLDHLSLSLGTFLPELSRVGLPAEGLTPISETAAVEFLARESLPSIYAANAPAPSPAAAARPEAARLISAALADPAKWEALSRTLRERGGESGARAADQLDAAARSTQLSPLFERLGRDFSDTKDFESRLSALFDGGTFAPRSVAPRASETPESFVAYAQRRFAAGRARLGVLAANRIAAGVPTDWELHDSVALSPLTNPERERVLIDLFERAGASREEIHLQDAGRGRSNIYVVKPGKSDRIVVVGGHHDKVSRGAGTIDNWTGATMVANLYQAMRDLATDATIVFVGFAREEEGLLGSKAFLREMPAEERKRIDAMVNLDTLAVDGTFSWRNNSDRSLLDLIQRVAARARLALTETTLWGGDADSSSFRRYGIPAITVFGASQDVIFDIIHSERDTIAAFSLPHYKNAFLLTLETMKTLAEKPLSGFARWTAAVSGFLRAAFRPS